MKTKRFIVFFFFFLTSFFSFGQNANFNADTLVGCIPHNVSFNNLSPNATSFQWYFGDGNQSQLENPVNTYIQSGVYTITLIVGFANSPNDTLIKNNYVEVIDAPNANFSVTNNGSDCENDNLYTFNNQSSNASSYTWDFGDGNTTNLINPSHTYSSSGTHNILLVAFNSHCFDTMSHPAINIFENPIVTANSSATFSCDSNNLYNFTAATVNNQSNLVWQWDFGDGNLSGVNNPSHNYNTTGTFNPFVIATNSSMCIDTFYLNPIENWDFPSSSLSADNFVGCEPFSTLFSIHSTNNTLSTIDWNFGAGAIISTSSDTITHQYANSGTFNVSALLTFANGCNYQIDQQNPIIVNPAPSATYSFSDSNGCAPLTVQFQSSTNIGNSVIWNFGDDSSFVSQGSPSHTYLSSGLFFPQLTVTDSLGCSNTYTLDTINSGGFIADFTPSIQTGCTPLTVDFTSTNSGATNWYWDFGDGNSSTLAHPTHTYLSSGDFDVSLSITNSSGCIDTITYSSLIQPITEIINLPSSDSIFTCSPFTFNPNVQNLALTNYQWDFGDGTTATGSNPSHQYQNSGLFNVNLSATTPNGCLAEIDDFAIVTIDGVTIDLDVSLSNCDSSIVNVNNNSTGITSSTWIVGTDTLNTSSINHQLSGSTLIQYYATSTIGCDISQYLPILVDCDSTTTNDTIVFTPPMDTLPVNPNNPGGVVTYPIINYTCGPELTNLISPFSNATSFYWDFGDGTTSSMQNPSHLYNTSGSFHLIHKAYYANGDSLILLIDYFINQHVANVDFNYLENQLCNSVDVNFTSTSTGATSWLWNFGNGNLANTPNTSFSFPIDNTSKTVSLTVTDSNNCSATKTQVLSYFEPIVELNQDTLICYGDTLSISVQSGTLFSYNWDMDDGNNYTNGFVEHEYLTPGNYNVTLELTDNNGCVRNISVSPINVFQPVSTFSPNSPLSICVGENVTFTSNNTFADSYSWYFPQGKSGNPKTYIYNNPGTYDVTHRILENGCISETTIANLVTVNEAEVNFNYTQLNACLPITVNFSDQSINAISWNWNFGDGNFSTTQNPHHNFNFVPNNDITLSIVDANGCSGSYSLNNISTLTNEFYVSDTLVCVNSDINFTSSSPLANNWYWSFGDGNTSNIMNPIHQYSSPGLYDISLIVDDGQGCIDTLIKQQLIEVQQVDAQFTYTSPTACPPIISQFNNSSTGATNYNWYFGDGSTSVIPSPSHIYTAAGTYIISLVATNDIGCRDSISSSNPIVVPGPIIDFSINHLIGCDSLTIEITNNTSNANNFLWNFGNGDTSSVLNPIYTYSSPGSYSVTLTAFDSLGCISYLQNPLPIEVIETPNANFTTSQQHVCIPSTVTFNNNSLNAVSYYWTFGNQNSTLENPSFNVFQIGNQPIELIANNQMCSDTIEHNIVGHFEPAVSIVDPGVLCENNGEIQLQTSTFFNNNVSWFINGNSSNGIFDPRDFSGSNVTIVATSTGFCPSSDTVNISILPVPDATILSNNLQLCEGESGPTLLAQQQGGIWSGPNINPVTGSLNTNGLTQGNYTITYTINTQCSNSDSIQLSIMHQPIISITDPGLICSNLQSTTLSANYPSGIWMGSSINSSTGEISINNLNVGFHNYIYSIEGDCPSSDTIEIEVTEFLDATILQPIAVCESNQLINLNTINTGGTWSGTGINNNAIGVFNTSNLSAGTYVITYQTSGLCYDTDSTYLYIQPNPILDFEFENPTHCIGSDINIINNSSSIDNENYQWFIDDSLVSTSPSPSFTLELGGYDFTVEIINEYGCKLRANINESLVVYDTTPLPAPEIIRSTVINDQDVYTEWAPKQNAVNEVKEYVLFKSIDQLNYEYLGTFDISVDNYIDPDVDVFNQNYTYYVVSINKCNVPSNASNISSSVLLGYEKPNEFQTVLRWSSYENWDKGVNRYEIQKLNEYGQWEVLKVVNPDINNTLIDP
ncbi:MAG: hypothetical protein CL853_09055 [Crocinitomicaceae bacterium]|nr:hypothetical protein [Crocinitomicaceae bacterium]